MNDRQHQELVEHLALERIRAAPFCSDCVEEIAGNQARDERLARRHR